MAKKTRIKTKTVTLLEVGDGLELVVKVKAKDVDGLIEKLGGVGPTLKSLMDDGDGDGGNTGE